MQNGEAKFVISLESRVGQLDKSAKEHVKFVAQLLKEQEMAVENHTMLLDRSSRKPHILTSLRALVKRLLKKSLQIYFPPDSLHHL